MFSALVDGDDDGDDDVEDEIDVVDNEDDGRRCDIIYGGRGVAELRNEVWSIYLLYKSYYTVPRIRVRLWTSRSPAIVSPTTPPSTTARRKLAIGRRSTSFNIVESFLS